jgi:hypothetical protein
MLELLVAELGELERQGGLAIANLLHLFGVMAADHRLDRLGAGVGGAFAQEAVPAPSANPAARQMGRQQVGRTPRSVRSSRSGPRWTASCLPSRRAEP